MAYPNHRFRNHMTQMPGGNGKQDPKVTVVVAGLMFMMGLVFFLPLFPPFGILWMIVSGIALKKGWEEIQKEQKKGQRPTQTPSASPDRGKKPYDRNMKEFMQRMERTIMARDVEEKEFRSHGHTPVSYSYDKCARDKRMEQVETLYKAGLYTEEEYRQKKREVAGK